MKIAMRKSATLLLVIVSVIAIVTLLGQPSVASAAQVSADGTQSVNDFSQYFGGGTGSDINPYLITNEKQLRNISETALEDSYTGSMRISSCFKLTKDIFMTSPWEVITAELRGTLDGDGHTIYNLEINITDTSKEDYFGMFRRLASSGTIKNLTMERLTINCTSGVTPTRIIVGGLAGYGYGKITNCKVSGTINCPNLYNGWLGGFVGVNAGNTIESCVNSADIYGCGIMGGIVAVNTNANSNIIGCKNSGDMYYSYLQQNGYVGGIAGRNSFDAQIQECINYGKIIYAGPQTGEEITPYMAQIVGYFAEGTQRLNYCYGTCDYSKLTSSQRTYCSTTASGYPNTDKPN